MTYDVARDERFIAMFRDAAFAADTPAVRRLAITVGGIHPPEAAARALLRAVQQAVRYTPTDTWRLPTETLLAGEGDCKDGAVFIAALYQACGWPIRLVAYGRGPTPTHVVTQVKLGGRWLWAETTVPAELGEDPWQAYLRTRSDDAAVREDLGAPASRHAWARDVITEAFKAQLGREPTRFERQMIQGVAATETSYGRGWGPTCKGACVGSHNWGAIQATASQPSCPCSDSHQDGTRYAQGFRTYASDVDGARDLVRHMTTLRPMTAAALAAGSGSDAVARAMYLEKYFGAGCPTAIKTYGPGTHRQSSMYTRGGATTEAGKACDAEAVGQYANKLARHVQELATALDEPVPPRTSRSLLLPALAVIGAGAFWAYRKGMFQ